MILILGSSNYEQGTDPVIDWLIFYKAPFLKITLNDLFYSDNKIKVDIQNKQIYYNNINLTQEVTVVFYRHLLESFLPILEETYSHNRRINKETYGEIECFINLLGQYLNCKKWFSNMESIYLNKLTVLNVAMESGLSIPYSEIVSWKEDGLNLFKKKEFKKIILKPFSDRNKSYYTFGSESYLSFAKEFTIEDIHKLEDYFFPSLFQEKLNTEFEIRVFYLDGEFFSSAIFIEGGYTMDDRKKVMDNEKLYVVRYKLPVSIENAIIILMNKLNLSIGAIDLIYTTDGMYYFLEVNPIGQYLYESEKNNFFIEKRIAEKLMKYTLV
ncbi:hypothetical protein [Myroides odoratus]|uniref:hypothetical protein n=1 Tax=Myroides odoratus TaxID=256 RepID=UPI0039AF8FE3